MASTQLPPLAFDDGGFRIALLLPEPEPGNGVSTPPAAGSACDHEPALYGTLSSACYSGRGPPANRGSDDSHENDMPEPPADPPQPDIPLHPIPALQEAFAESLDEVTSGLGGTEKPGLRGLDAEKRRRALLAQARDDLPFDAAWRLRPGQSQHEVAKLIAQISFGMCLLLNGMANSNTQVVNILQGHIDEVDEFLEVTIEDVAQAEKDLTRCIDRLALSISNMGAFEKMLEDRSYRAEILEGNEKMAHVMARTTAATKQWNNDIRIGLQSSTVFIIWLNEHREGTWRTEQPDVVDIFDAMNGNAEGWLIAFERIGASIRDMKTLGNRLRHVTSKMEKKAGDAGRRTWANAAAPAVIALPRLDFSRNASSPTLPTSLHGSLSRSNTPSTIRSGSTSGFQPTISTDNGEEIGAIQFPMPRGVPLLSPLRVAPPTPDVGRVDIDSKPSHHLAGGASADPEEDLPSDDETSEVPAEIETLLLLQPRTYTPLPPAPLPSPLVKDDAAARWVGSEPRSSFHSEPRSENQSSAPAKPQSRAWETREAARRRPSLRQRVSLRTSPPEHIHIPPRRLPGIEPYAPSSANPHLLGSSSYVSDADLLSHARPSTATSRRRDLSPPVHHNNAVSPRSDQLRYYHPVIASPHSPLQQRPHTAVGHSQPAYQHSGPTLAPPHSLRNKPSQLGSMSMLSNVTTESFDGRSIARSSRTTKPGDKKLKKKKSAFGWLKKAFSMDEEERAAYEARKAMQHQDQYFSSGSPKFLDGRRLR